MQPSPRPRRRGVAQRPPSEVVGCDNLPPLMGTLLDAHKCWMPTIRLDAHHPGGSKDTSERGDGESHGLPPEAAAGPIAPPPTVNQTDDGPSNASR